MGGHGLVSVWLTLGKTTGSFECGVESLLSEPKNAGINDWFRNCSPLNKEFAPWRLVLFVCLLGYVS